MPFIVFMILIGAIPLAVWIYLVFMVWKKKTNIFHDQMESKLAESRLKWLKIILLLAGLSLVTFIGNMLHIALFSPPDYEGGFFIAFFSIILFLIGLIGSLVIIRIGRRKTT